MSLNNNALEVAYHAFGLMNIGGSPVPKYAIDEAIKAYLFANKAQHAVEQSVIQQPTNSGMIPFEKWAKRQQDLNIVDAYAGWAACNEWYSIVLDSEEMQEKFAGAIYKSVYSNQYDYHFSEHKELYKKHAKAALKIIKEAML